MVVSRLTKCLFIIFNIISTAADIKTYNSPKNSTIPYTKITLTGLFMIYEPNNISIVNSTQ